MKVKLCVKLNLYFLCGCFLEECGTFFYFETRRVDVISDHIIFAAKIGLISFLLSSIRRTIISF